jgi:hypothetical protein
MPAPLICNIWWPTFGNAERSLFLSLSLSLSAQCLNTESIVKDVLCHICVHTLTRPLLGYQLGPKSLVRSRVSVCTQIWHRTSFTIDWVLRHCAERERQRGSFQRWQMYVTKYYPLVVLALLAAHHIFHISRIKVNPSNSTLFITLLRISNIFLMPLLQFL